MPRLKRKPALLLPVIGWREHVSLPRLNIGPIVAKIDTGARTSSLHANEIHISGRRVRFRIYEDGKWHSYQAPLVGHKRVKSSNGISEIRAVIRATIAMGEHLFKTEITLTDRTDMGVPMLIGRSTIKGHFLVNPARSFLLKKQKKAQP